MSEPILEVTLERSPPDERHPEGFLYSPRLKGVIEVSGYEYDIDFSDDFMALLDVPPVGERGIRTTRFKMVRVMAEVPNKGGRGMSRADQIEQALELEDEIYGDLMAPEDYMEALGEIGRTARSHAALLRSIESGEMREKVLRILCEDEGDIDDMGFEWPCAVHAAEADQIIALFGEAKED